MFSETCFALNSTLWASQRSSSQRSSSSPTTRIAPPPQIEFADDALRRFVEQNGLSAYAAAILGVADSLADLVAATDEDVDELAAETRWAQPLLAIVATRQPSMTTTPLTHAAGG